MDNDKQKEKNIAKEIIKRIIFSIVKKIILISLPIIIILLLICVWCWYVLDQDGKWSKDEKGSPSMYTKNTVISGTDGITVDKNKLVENALMSMGYTQERIQNMSEQKKIEILQFGLKLGREISSFDECTEAEILWCTNSIYSKYLRTPEDLQMLLDAELITQYPKIDGLENDPSKLNGIIEFERYTTDPDTNKEYVRTLKYVSNDEFTAKFNNYQQTGNEEIFDCFTLDEEGNVKIATWTREEGSYSSNNTTSQTNRKKIRAGVTAEEINSNYDSRYAVNTNNADTIQAAYTTYYITEQTIYYKNYVQQYTLSFEYLWSLLVTIGKSSNQFVLDLAQLAHNSEIKIGIFDNINKTIKTDEETYREEFEYRYVLLEDGSVDEYEYEPEEHDYVHTNIVTTYQDTAQMEVIYANVWSAEVTVKWNNTVSDQSSEGYDNVYEQPNLPEGNTDICRYIGQRIDWYTDDEEKHWSKSEKDEEGNEVSSTDYDKYICNHERTINRVNTSKTNLITSQYQKEPSDIRRKDDLDETTDDNFVKALRRDTNAYTVLTKPINFELWSQILLQNEDTDLDRGQLVDLTKYFIYKATKSKYFETDFNFDYFETSSFQYIGTGSEGGLSLTTTMFTKDVFKQALQAYYEKTHNQDFYNNFLLKADELYNASISNNVNPELVVITAKGEGNFKESGGKYNYWGLNVPNGAKSGDSFSSLTEGVEAYARYIHKYESGNFAAIITQRYEERKAAGCDPLGYGLPGTLSGMQSIYSYLGKHEYGSSGSGGYYYMDPARAGVTKIYSTHEEFLKKCKDSGLAEHAPGTETTPYEQGQYTAWQVEQKLKYWDEIFGNYGSRAVTGGNSDIVEIAKSKIGCPYIYGARGPNSFDCSGFVYWCYQQIGITVPKTTSGYKPVIGTAKEISWADAQPGDILIVTDTERGKANGHAAIYLGNDSYIHAPQSGDVVKIVKSGAQSKFRHVFRYEKGEE